MFFANFTVNARRNRAAIWLILVLEIFALASCDSLFKRARRRFGVSCGRNGECEGGKCFQGHCTQACTTGGECESGVCLETVCQQSDEDFDGDGLLNKRESKIGTDAGKIDTDGDGIPDGVEVGIDPDHPIDSNADGIPDALQSNINDLDGDCIPDVFDKIPNGSDPLPAAADLCNQGVCADNLDKITVVCKADTPSTAASTAAGCKGCVCDGTGVKDWQSPETGCDKLDNDCDGKTDNGLVWKGIAVGEVCHADVGICQLDAAGNLAQGVVKCAADKTATCSTLETLKKAETCNGVDDDCDGKTDNGFLWKTKEVGATCGECYLPPVTCADGSGAAISSATVACTADGKTASCSALAFAKEFQIGPAGAPQPRRSWSAAVMGGSGKLMVYGGQVIGFEGYASRDDRWTLALPPQAQQSNPPQPWQWSGQEAPGLSTDAALIWDEIGKQAVLTGGHGDQATHIWTLDAQGKWLNHSDLADDAPGYLKPLPFDPTEKFPTQAAILQIDKCCDKRMLVVAIPGQPDLLQLPMDATQGDDWTVLPLPNDPTPAASGSLLCLTTAPDKKLAIALTDSKQLFMLSVLPGDKFVSQTELKPLGASSGADVGDNSPQCVINDQGQLHIFGGHNSAKGHGKHVVGTIDLVSKSIDFKIAADAPKDAVLFARSSGFAQWNPSSKSIVFGGGYRYDNDGMHRQGLHDVWSVQGLNPPQRLDTEAPQGRIGQASGWSQKTQQFCIAGGLTIDLPDTDDDSGRTLPVTDAWCSAPTGPWVKLATNKPVLFAFGQSAIDAVTNRLVLVGGLQLTEKVVFDDIHLLWKDNLPRNKKQEIDSNWAPVVGVRTLDLASGIVAAAASTGAPTVTAASQAVDVVRNMLIVFGGFDAKFETQTFRTLDLATLKWTDLAVNFTQDGKGPLLFLPPPRYGALLLYDPLLSLVTITGGAERQIDNKTGALGEQILVDIPPLPGGKSVQDQACFGFDFMDLWAYKLPTPALTKAHIVLPTYADPGINDKPLLQQFFGGPLFAPVLYDAAGSRAFIVAQGHNQPESQLDGKGVKHICPKPSEANILRADVTLAMSFGTCGKAPDFQNLQAHLDPSPTKVPPSAILSSTAYVDSSRMSLLWGGLNPDATPATGLWRLDQTCATKP